MSENELDLLLNYPLIKKQPTKNGFSYSGSIEVNSVDYNVKVKCGKNKFIFHDLDVFNYVKNDLNLKIEGKSDILEIFDILRDFIKSKTQNSVKCINKGFLYHKVLHEYTEFTKFYLNLTKCSLSYDFTKISISIEDDTKKTHSIVIDIDSNEFSNIFKLETYDLPNKIRNVNLFKSNSSLTMIFDQFLATVEILKPYFDFMEHLDNTAWILDPILPKNCDKYRRINLGENTSVTITVDPYNIQLRPDIKFLGPERVVEKYRDKLNSKLDSWDNNEEPYCQFLQILGIEHFPQKPKDSLENLDMLKTDNECSICFSFHLNEEIPDIICTNKHCESCYHSECLYEWLISVNARRVFSELNGLCPSCEKQISCPIPM